MNAFFLERLKEPSTWRGFVLLLTAIGVPLSPALADTIITIGLAITGFIGVATPDK